MQCNRRHAFSLVLGLILTACGQPHDAMEPTSRVATLDPHTYDPHLPAAQEEIELDLEVRDLSVRSFQRIRTQALFGAVDTFLAKKDERALQGLTNALEEIVEELFGLRHDDDYHVRGNLSGSEIRLAYFKGEATESHVGDIMLQAYLGPDRRTHAIKMGYRKVADQEK